MMTWQIPDPATQPDFYTDVPVKRLIAWSIDMAIVLLICLLILPFTAFTGIFFIPLLIASVYFCYRLITMIRSSATPGMRIMAIEFMSLTGERLDPIRATWMSFGLTMCIVFPIFMVVSSVLMMISVRGQGLVDMMLGVVVINRRAGL